MKKLNKLVVSDLLALQLSPEEISKIIGTSHTAVYSLKAQPTKNFKVPFKLEDFESLSKTIIDKFFVEQFSSVFLSISFSLFSFLQHFDNLEKKDEKGKCRWCSSDASGMFCNDCQMKLNDALYVAYTKKLRKATSIIEKPVRKKKSIVKGGFKI